ncbi:glycosyltransferase [Candidatus Peregrinibacteria bacterium]|nr:glycosyltransferase [Candidatus Peregrinibacteria bacterium]
MSLQKAKIALVFDWMTNPGGAEKVNKVLHQIFPQSPIYTSIYNPKKVTGFEDAAITTSFIQNLPLAKTKHQYYLGLMPYAYEAFDLSSFDIVISSSHSCAKGIITKPETMHVCYCHTPMRYAWDNWHSYIKQYKMNPILKYFGKKRMHKLRIWDKVASERPDFYIANSSITQKRIAKFYRKESKIIYPMIKCSKFKIAEKTKGYFLAVGRLTHYKRFDLIIETFNKIGLPLKIVGTGVDSENLKKIARGNIEFIGYASDQTLHKLYSEAEALIFPQIEDFGIIPLESMASGRPVIAYKKGGAMDTIEEGETGIFFNKQTPLHLEEAIKHYLENKKTFKPEKIREHCRKFDESNFKKNLFEFLNEKWVTWEEGR